MCLSSLSIIDDFHYYSSLKVPITTTLFEDRYELIFAYIMHSYVRCLLSKNKRQIFVVSD